MSYNIPQSLLDILQTGPLPVNIKIVNNHPGGAGPGSVPDGSWANPYLTIQSAIDSIVPPVGMVPATWYDFIWVMGGAYTETLTITQPKALDIYSLGQVYIFGDVNWDVLPAVPGVPDPSLTILPMPAGISSDRPVIYITGALIYSGDPVQRTNIMQGVHVAGGIQGKNPENDPLVDAWVGNSAILLDCCKIENGIKFADGNIYTMSFKHCKIDGGIFCTTVGVPNLDVLLEDTEITPGTFNPWGEPLWTAAALLRGAELAAKDMLWDGFFLVNTLKMDVSEGTGTSEFVVPEAFWIKDSTVEGATILGTFGTISNSIFQGDFTVMNVMPGPPQGMITGTVVQGLISLTDAPGTFIDIATNDMSKRAATSIGAGAWPAGTTVLTDAVP